MNLLMYLFIHLMCGIISIVLVLRQNSHKRTLDNDDVGDVLILFLLGPCGLAFTLTCSAGQWFRTVRINNPFFKNNDRTRILNEDETILKNDEYMGAKKIVKRKKLPYETKSINS